MSKIEFKELPGKRYRVVGSNNLIVSEKEKLKIEKDARVLADIKSNKCQGENTKKIKELEEEIKDLEEKEAKVENSKTELK